jgi:hypothetical protein
LDINIKMPGRGAAKKNPVMAVAFTELFATFKGKCSDLKEEQLPVSEIITGLNEHIAHEKSATNKLNDNEKTALDVVALLLPVLEVLTSSIVAEHETKINRLQASVRSNEYANDALEQYTRRENIRITNLPEDSNGNLVEVLANVGGEIGGFLSA